MRHMSQGDKTSTCKNGTRGYDQIHQPGEPGCVPPPYCRPAGHRHVLHCLVLRLRGDLNKIHQGRLQRAADLPRGFTFHGLRCAVLTTLGWHLCMKFGVPDLKEYHTFQWNGGHHTQHGTGFNWTALMTFWDHMDSGFLVTSKGDL
ncbi:hypothetical protein PFLUV_G00098510 [Perca fluviatilis]|uniref:Uncharacterized protein n=1 Tax=Perca fluviatilis TaxID=8168 RepID=A0A6A5EC31_PERFL|nr:hypothetical protein PFLUV_G00098510 [Perca fluviatilis]